MPSEASLANLQPAWQPGRSANERGATKGYRRVLAESRRLSFEALQTVTACMRSQDAPWPSRLRAAEIILDRAWGEPDKNVQLEVDNLTEVRIVFVRAQQQGNGKLIEGEPAQSFSVSFEE